MIKVGEATGSLDEMLSSVSDYFDESVGNQGPASADVGRTGDVDRHGSVGRSPLGVDLPADVRRPESGGVKVP